MPIFASNFASNSLSGTARVVDGFANITLPTIPYALEGDKTFVIKIRKDSATGDILSTSPVLTFKDPSSFVSLTANVSTVAEGNLVAFTLVTANAVNGANLFYSVFPVTANVTAGDFTANTGTFTITNNAGTFALRANADVSLSNEDGETFRVQLRTTDSVGNVVFTTSNVVILDTYKTYNVLSLVAGSASPIASGSNVSFTFTATNVPSGTLFYYNTTGNVTSFSSNTGSFALNSTSNTIVITNPQTPFAASRSFNIIVRSGSESGPVLATSNTMVVLDGSLNIVSASGGSQSNVSGYRIHTFTSSSNLTILSGGPIEYLVVAGGGGGGGTGGSNGSSGGGGAGGYLTATGFVVSAGTPVAVTVGGGGAGGPGIQSPPSQSAGFNGANSSIIGFTSVIATGGGGGGAPANGVTVGGNHNGQPGGSGGGSGWANQGNAGIGISGQGFNGVLAPSSQYAGGGGGGASATGSAQNGGAGISSNISGTATFYAGGGGGGAAGAWSPPAWPGGTGGTGGGASGVTSGAGQSGTTNTGGGGGGVNGLITGSPSLAQDGGAGGSGIVIIKYYANGPAFVNITTPTTFVNQESNVVFTLNTTDVANNTLLYYYTVGNVISSNFVTGNTGSFRTTLNSTGITLQSNITIPTNEERIFQLIIAGDTGTSATPLITSNVFTIKSPTLFSASYLVVAGGGAGAINGSAGAGGGGGGGLLSGNITSLYSGKVLTCTVGAGAVGAIDTVFPNPGSNSSIQGTSVDIVAFGGGSGYPYNGPPGRSGAGGSGGGGTSGRLGGLGTPGQGYNGGTDTSSIFGGGGGGAGGEGGNNQPNRGGAGGSGAQWPVSPGTYYAGGGGGSSSGNPTDFQGLGGAGGGGNGTPAVTEPGVLNPGTVNTGGGGGGAWKTGTMTVGAAGGSGITILRYSDTLPAATSTTGTPNVTVSGGFRIYKFTNTGTITF